MGAVDPGFISISLQVTGQRELTGKLATWGANVQHLTPAWEQVGDSLLQDFRQQFADEGGYLGAQVGPKWAPLKPSTIKDRLRHGYGASPILVREGLLRDSLSWKNAAGNIFQATDSGITVGTTVRYAGFQQYGTHQHLVRDTHQRKNRHLYSRLKQITGQGGIPPRKMVGLKYSTRSAILRILGDYIREQARAAGLMVDMGAATSEMDTGGGPE